MMIEMNDQSLRSTGGVMDPGGTTVNGVSFTDDTNGLVDEGFEWVSAPKAYYGPITSWRPRSLGTTCHGFRKL